MAIIYKKGNVLDTTDRYIVHGCNSRKVMGSGVALAIRQKYPKAYEDYKKELEELEDISEESRLGKIIFSEQPDGKIIVNAITQEFYGKEPLKYVSYDAIDEAMLNLDYVLTIYSEIPFVGNVNKFLSKDISMPKIGAGLGGGNWNVIEAIINHRLSNHNVTVWELE